MRRRLFRGVVAATLAVAVMVPGSVEPVPARADPLTDLVQQSITIANSTFAMIGGLLGGGTPPIASIIQQLLAKIDLVKTQILSHIDAIATAEAQACARHSVIEFADINNFNQTVLQSWAQSATGCVTQIGSLLSTVVDKGQVDQLGFALNIAGTIAMAARAKAGFSVSLLAATLRDGYNTVISRLAPRCDEYSVFEDPPGLLDVWYNCTAYNGDTAGGVETWYHGQLTGLPIDQPAVQNLATSRTSRAVAQAALPCLQGL